MLLISVETEKEAVLKEKAVQIEKAVEVKAKEEKVELTSFKLNIEKINKETSPLPNENESSNWTAVFDKNTGCYYYWNRVNKQNSLLFIENKRNYLDLSRVCFEPFANVLDALLLRVCLCNRV